MEPRPRAAMTANVAAPESDARTTVVSLGVGAAIWELVARVSDRLPSLGVVLSELVELTRTGVLMPSLAASLASLAIGLIAAAVVGVFLGVLIGRWRTIEHLVDVYLDAVMSAPTLIYVPILFALFGVSRASQVAVVFAYAFFIIVTTTSAAVRGVDMRLVDMARAFGASERQLFWTVVLPASRATMLTGLSLGATRAVKGMVVGEMVIALSGLGALLRTASARVDVERTLALLLVILVVSVCSHFVVGRLGRAWIDG